MEAAAEEVYFLPDLDPNHLDLDQSIHFTHGKDLIVLK